MSKDEVLAGELKSGLDIHGINQARFNLPERVIAKKFVFRLLYGGQAYSYANDSEFNHVSKSQDYWQRVIDEFYNKYKTIAGWHKLLVQEVLSSGRLIMPTGRIYNFDRREVARNPFYWRPKILNYPVQGTGADLVAIGRVTANKRLRKAGLPFLWQSTVHDSIDIDVDGSQEVCYNIAKIVKESIEDIPTNFYRLFGVEFNLPVSCEIGIGPTLGDLQPYGEDHGNS